ncbi:MAG TPA: site-specific integrase [Xanthobacteraceae bacterium]|nr:site-specific integrase [Xanthobacteraceae bacterium]
MLQRQQERPAGLRVVVRKDTGALTIVGTVAGQRVRQRAQSGNFRLATEEARLLEADLLKTEWLGERRGARSFGDAAESYLNAAPRSANHYARIVRLLLAIGDPPLNTVNQQTAIDLKNKMLRPGASPRAYADAVIMPLRAILHHAQRQGWCAMPYFAMPKATPGRTLYLLPGQVERLIVAAAPHLRPLLIFLVGTGARMAEALELDWRDVDLQGGRAIFWKTKNGKRRNVELPSAIVPALANLSHREGKVFRWQDRAGQLRDYADHQRRYGGQIKTAWAGALKRAGLSDAFHPHDLRHTWASWHYATHRDLLRLKAEGGWSSVALVERYAHLLPAGHEDAIRQVWHGS